MSEFSALRARLRYSMFRLVCTARDLWRAVEAFISSHLGPDVHQ